MEILNILKIMHFIDTLIAFAGFWHSKRILTGFGFPAVKSYLIKREPRYNFIK